MYFWINLSGEHDTEVENETVTFTSKAVGATHPNFFYRLSTGTIKFDVALLTLETPIDFSNETFSHIRWVNIFLSTRGRSYFFLQPGLSYVNIPDLFVWERTRISVWTWKPGLEQWRDGEPPWWITSTVNVVTREESQGMILSQKYWRSCLVSGDTHLNQIDRPFFLFSNNYTRFLSLDECYETFDDIRTNRCPEGPQIEEEGNIHICGSSLAGDFCNGDSGSGLIILDKQIR